MEEIGEVKFQKKSGISKLGKCIVWYSQGKITYTIGPDWMFNLCLLSIIISAMIFNVLVMAPMVDPTMQFIGFSAITWVLMSYLMTALKNPGIVVNDTQEEIELGKAENKSFCRVCHVMTAKGTEHCEDCGLCCEGYDHHCPLSGKCIGKGNIIWFYLFLASILGFFVYFMVWAFMAAKLQFERTARNN
ncbi:unnamed protein product [Blepharisma stoltei]|uniref:Palmitoyltransferase n=1 Tax=Blepharisma stoltei TaxID=1481888 RepID=A0AAU9JF45_9CILI|nr:unnamed protein product [Blepharisma stoltei]